MISNQSSDFKLRPALCLDFDDTIRRSKSGQASIQGPGDIELMPGIEKILWHYRDMNWLVFGITNQAGVAHGYKFSGEIEVEMDTTLKLFERNPFHIVKVCFHDETGTVEPYCHRSLSHKPDIGMLAIIEMDAWERMYIVDWNRSLFVGDRPEDEECARRAGIPFRHTDSFLSEPHTFEIA